MADARVTAPPERGSLRMNVRGVLFAVFTGFVAFFACLRGDNLFFAIACVLFGVLAASAIFTVLVGRRIEVRRVLPETVSAGDMITATVRFRNAKRILPAFCVRLQDRLALEGLPVTLQPSPVWLPYAKPGERVRGLYTMTIQHRGWARLGPFTLNTEFPPGLFTWRTVIPVKDQVLAYPRRAVLNRRVLNPYLSRTLYTDAVPRAFTPGDEEFAGLRDYRPGDNPRRIHWKMSARLRNRLLVREFEDTQVRNAAILLETYVPSHGDLRLRRRLERAIVFAAALTEALLEENCRVRFRTCVPEPVSLTLEPSRGAIDGLLRVLAELRPTHQHTLQSLMAFEEGSRDEVIFLLRIGRDPLPPWEPLSRAVVLDPQRMKDLLQTTSWEQ